MGPETNGALIFVRLKQAGVPDSDAARERWGSLEMYGLTEEE